ncbi:hypothetical protein A3K73_04470 [Candidatus Pacearchaeota archaeon RBG_13_36_9]|nr:MAG: hypothetical protein A3K73_04470 [Candidatus Pacearchaeota archaeon RBG_13_36_9]
MKKAGVIILIILLLASLSFKLISAQDITDPSRNTAGGINEETGLPNEFNKFQELASNLSEEEQRKEYLKQEWAKIFAENKYLGPVLFYTNKLFSFLNPIWEVIFKIEFSWSWSFIFSLSLWIMLIVAVYYPAKPLSKSNLVGFLIAVIVASLMGLTGIIKEVVEVLRVVITNFWIAIGFFIIIIIASITYSQVMRNLEKKAGEQELEAAREKIKAEGKVAGQALNDLAR